MSGPTSLQRAPSCCEHRYHRHRHYYHHHHHHHRHELYKNNYNKKLHCDECIADTRHVQKGATTCTTIADETKQQQQRQQQRRIIEEKEEREEKKEDRVLVQDEEKDDEVNEPWELFSSVANGDTIQVKRNEERRYRENREKRETIETDKDTRCSWQVEYNRDRVHKQERCTRYGGRSKFYSSNMLLFAMASAFFALAIVLPPGKLPRVTALLQTHINIYSI